jgi:hypothetical protein
MSNPASGAAARMYAGGPPDLDNLVVEDAVSGDAYRYVNPGWKRVRPRVDG